MLAAEFRAARFGAFISPSTVFAKATARYRLFQIFLAFFVAIAFFESFDAVFISVFFHLLPLNF